MRNGLELMKPLEEVLPVHPGFFFKNMVELLQIFVQYLWLQTILSFAQSKIFFSYLCFVMAYKKVLSFEIPGLVNLFSIALWKQGSCSQEQSGFGGPEVRTNDDFDKSQENGCLESGKVRIFVFFATWKSILVKNGLTFVAVILFNISSK